MAGKMKLLAKETAVYGMSSIVGKFLNWLLVPMHSHILLTGEYGVVTNIYAYTALLVVFLTYGMETGFFRFMNKEGENPNTVYSTSLISLGITSLLFIITCFVFVTPISEMIDYQAYPEYILIMALVMGLDAFSSIPFAYLRYKRRPMRFAIIKIVNISVNIFFNIFFLFICPVIYESNPHLIDWFYSPTFRCGYIFMANLLATIVTFIMLMPYLVGFKYTFDTSLLKRMLKYSLPLLVLGVVGILNQNIDKIIYPFLFEDKEAAFASLGVYGACSRMAVVMLMFTQAFRFAYEPFVFANNKKEDLTTYSQAMKYFVIFSLLVFVGVMFYMDVLKDFIGSSFQEGLEVVPIIMMGYIFFGIYFNLSFWYKLVDKTFYGAIFSAIGCVITVAIIIIFVPVYGYIASAWASLICNLVMMAISYFVGQREYPINYDIKSLCFYFVVATVLYVLGFVVTIDNIVLRLLYRTALFVVFLAIVVKKDLPLASLPYVNRFIKNK